MATARRAIEDIEATADYYGPGTYQELLTFYNDYTIEADSQSGTFFPISQINRNPKDSLVFAVGLLPPAVNVTGRLLDRSASILRVDGAEDFFSGTPTQAQLTQEDVTVEEDPKGMNVPVSDGASMPATLPPSIVARNNNLIAGLHPSIQPLVQRMIAQAAAEGLQVVVIEGFRSEERQQELYSRGRDNDQAKVTNAKPGFSMHNFGLAVDVAFVKNAQGGVFWPRDLEPWDRIGAIGKGVGLRWGGTDFPGFTDRPHFELRGNLNINQIRAGQRPPIPPPAPEPVAADESSEGWQRSGSKDAQEADREQRKLEGSPLLNSSKGRALLAAQEAQIKAIQIAIDNMKKVPPLRMLVNPNKFGVKGAKIAQDGNWGRNGPIIEFWGDDQDKISGGGKVAGFFAMDSQNANVPGLTRWARNFSAGWQNFQSLVTIYRSNGAVFLPDFARQEKYQNLAMLGSVYIYYDNILYIGSFDSFNVTETDTAPHTVEYSFEFTVRASFLLDRIDDQFTYGAPSLFSSNEIQAVSGTATANTSVANIPDSPPVSASTAEFEEG